MARKSKGRGTAAAFGLLLLLAGLVGGGVLFALSVRRPSQAVDGFARAPVGCTTTLRFTETGTFYVFEDLGPVIEVPDGGCEPSADSAQSFAFELRGPSGPVVPRAADDLSYDVDDRVGTSVARVEITVAGDYEIVVVGDDPAVVAAIGRDPDDGVDDLRLRAIVVAVVGVVLGALLLLLAGLRSRNAASFEAPDGPGWGPRQSSADRIVVAEHHGATRLPVNPHQPDQVVDIAGPMSEVNDLLADPPPPKPSSPWAPPATGEAARAGPTVPPEPDPGPIEQALTATTDPDVPAAADELAGDAGEEAIEDAAVDIADVDDAAVDPEQPAG